MLILEPKEKQYYAFPGVNPVTDLNSKFHFNVMCYVVTIFSIFSFKGIISGGSQSSVAGYSQLPFPAASQTHLRSGTEGRSD